MTNYIQLHINIRHLKYIEHLELLASYIPHNTLNIIPRMWELANIIPRMWELANIIPITKPNKNNKVNTSFKLISSFSTLAKTLPCFHSSQTTPGGGDKSFS